MAATSVSTRTDQLDMAAPLAIVSCDGHIGPRLEDMRGYCPAARLAEYDELAAQMEAFASEFSALVPDSLDAPEARIHAAQAERMRAAAGAHDMHARLRDMNRDGVAAELIFHGVQDLRPVPWVGLAGFSLGTLVAPEQLELSALGLHIYNQWLADACSIEPERHVGAALLPMWDIDASVREMHWAREAGLRAVNFPAPRRGLRFFDDPAWEPFWSACETLEMPLVTHAGSIDVEETQTTGPHAVFLAEIESGGWPCRRALQRLIFGGVFERHPNLKLLLVEQNQSWWRTTIQEFDSAYQSHAWMVREQVPRPPSDYLHEQVFIGASFMAPFEAEAAVREGYVDNIMWGRDYPHVEGTWQPPVGDGSPYDNEVMTRLSIRYCYSAVEPRYAQSMLSDNGIRILNLDRDALTKVAEQIGAPNLTEVGRPIDAIPEPGRGGVLAFRTMGPWG